MKSFHISDVLSVTTGRLVSSRHMDGIYDLLNFLTGDSIYTHQIPRVMDECKPWLRAQFPELMDDSSRIVELSKILDERLVPVAGNKAKITPVITAWVEEVRSTFGLPELLPVYELGTEIHTRIDPIEEAEAMFGKQNVDGLTGDSAPVFKPAEESE